MKKEQIVKLPKGVTQQFLDSIQSKSIDDLKTTIVILQVQNQENETFKAGEEYGKAKEEFDIAKDKFNLVDGPIKEVTVLIKNRTKAVIDRLKEKGAC